MARQRKYSIDEIDMMRKAVRNLFPIDCSPKSPEIEDRLRTHMLNGTDPEELAEAGKAFMEKDFRRVQENHRLYAEMREQEEAAAKA